MSHPFSLLQAGAAQPTDRPEEVAHPEEAGRREQAGRREHAEPALVAPTASPVDVSPLLRRRKISAQADVAGAGFATFQPVTTVVAVPVSPPVSVVRGPVSGEQRQPARLRASEPVTISGKQGTATGGLSAAGQARALTMDAPESYERALEQFRDEQETVEGIASSSSAAAAAAAAGATWTPSGLQPLPLLSPLLGGLPVDAGGVGGIGEVSMAARTDQRAVKAAWETTLERAIESVVSIRATHVRSFDTDETGAYYATGFVVDKRQGIILSNRHVVSPGPITAKATFSDYEETTVRPLYRDPVHDFGFFRFDPRALKFMKCAEIPLNPTGARIGAEIRVVGNDAGEQLSILQGTLARLDRPAPSYGTGNYSDFNTFYYQAASSTSGGSSGSPVLNVRGQAVALNAGAATGSSQSYYLPLDRVDRALKYLQRGETHIPRGTIQVEWRYAAFDEARRLGLDQQTEVLLRKTFPERTGLLVASTVLIDGPAYRSVQNGDMLISVNGELTSHFVDLEATLDDNVGQDVVLQVQRGNALVEVTVIVEDLHSITPDEFVELGNGVYHPLSYQVARSFPGSRIGSVYVAAPGFSFVNAGVFRKNIVTSVNHTPTPDLDAFMEVLGQIADGEEVVIKHYSLYSKPRKTESAIVIIDRHFYPFRHASRDDARGTWNFRDLAPPHVPRTLTKPPGTTGAPITAEEQRPPLRVESFPATFVARSMVKLEVHVPYLVDGTFHSYFSGTGLVVDADLGLILTDHSVVRTAYASLITSTFFSGAKTTAVVVFMHPTHNFVILQYDTSKIPKSTASPNGVHAARLLDPFEQQSAAKEQQLEQRRRASAEQYEVVREGGLKPGSPVILIALGRDEEPVVLPTTVTGIVPLVQGLSIPPRFRSMNAEQITLACNDPAAARTQGGVIVNPESGNVYALWAGYVWASGPGEMNVSHTGLPVSYCFPALRVIFDFAYKRERPPRSVWSSMFSRREKEPAQVLSLPPTPPRHDHPFAATSSATERIPWKTNVGEETDPRMAVRLLDVQLSTVKLGEARSLGVSEEWMQRFGRYSDRQQMLRIDAIFPTTPKLKGPLPHAARVDLTAPTRAHISELPQSDDDTALQDGDLILQMDGEIMTSLQDVHRRLAFFAGASRSDLVWDVLVVRDGVERWCFVPVTNLPVLDPRQQYERHAAAAGFAHKLPGIAAGLLLGWCGGILLFPGRAVLEQVDPQAHPDVDFSALPYLSTVMLGSPFESDGLTSGYFILEVNGVSMHDPHHDFSPMLRFLDDWKAEHVADVTGEAAPSTYVRLKLVHRQGAVKVVSVRPDLHYWPSWLLESGQRRDL